MSKLLILICLFSAPLIAQENSYYYNYQNYPTHFGQIYNGHGGHGGHGGQGMGGGYGGNPYGGNTSLNNVLLRSVMGSLVRPGVSPNNRTSKNDFLKLWNQRFGYNFLSLEAVQENIGCRARCRRMSHSPVCGANRTRYFNSCDAQCDQVTYETSTLRYNKMCCCDDNSMDLTAGNVMCVVDNTYHPVTNNAVKMILNRCMYMCLEAHGDKVAQNSDMVVSC